MLNISYPMLFKVTNEKTGMSTHCGVLEFKAGVVQCHLPYWVWYIFLFFFFFFFLAKTDQSAKDDANAWPQ